MDTLGAVVALVYFGRLPGHFQLWLNSCEANPELDWLVLTDDPTDYRWPANVTRHAMTLEDMRARLAPHVDVSNLVTPYKLCDFRPVFGLALADLFAGYGFWGYCDADVIFGRIADFVTPEVLRTHDKVFKRGHLSLTRNGDDTNRIWSRAADRPEATTIAQVVATPTTLAFDESAGVHRIYLAEGRPVFTEEVALDISSASYRMRMTHFMRMLNRDHQAFCWRDGRLIQRYLDEGGEPREREFCYIHFQRRRMPMRVPPDAREFWIAPDGFRPIESLPRTPSEFGAINGPSLLGDARIKMGRVLRRARRVLDRRRLA